MKTKHTKGPWVTEDKTSVNEHGAIGIDISNEDGSTENLATVWCFDTDDEEGISNAKLISAAPDLLEALNTLVNRIENNWASITSGTQNGIITALLEESKEAIEKATK